MSQFPEIMKRSGKTPAGISVATVIAMISISPVSAFAADSMDEALSNGKFSVDVRARYENVSHDAFATNASAMTIRTRLGYGTEAYKGFKAFIEGDVTRSLENDNFNSTVNGRTAYPVVADPNSLRLNRMWVSYSGIADTTFKLGRQRIKLDNDRFVGNVGWRQNEQTYDAVRATNTSVENLKFEYIYAWQVNRIFGSRAAVPGRRFDGDVHLANASYNFKDVGKLTGYGYFIKLDQSAGLTNRTMGVRFAGGRDVSDGVKIIYAAEYAVQKDYKHNPADFSLNYGMASLGVKYSGFTAKATYEVLEGNGSRGFVTPLATLHAFQGFTDNFLATPTTGISETQGYVDYTFKNVGGIGKVKIAGWYRDFDADVGAEDLGEEIDFLIAFSPWKRWSVSFKYADYSGADLRPDVRKLWLTLGYKY